MKIRSGENTNRDSAILATVSDGCRRTVTSNQRTVNGVDGEQQTENGVDGKQSQDSIRVQGSVVC